MAGPTQIYGKGDVILSEGASGDRTFKILHGEVLICKLSKNKKQVPIAKLGPGDVFGEMYLIDSSGSRTATAIALEGVVVELIFQDQLACHINSLEPMLDGMLKGINKRLKHTTEICANPEMNLPNKIPESSSLWNPLLEVRDESISLMKFNRDSD